MDDTQQLPGPAEDGGPSGQEPEAAPEQSGGKPISSFAFNAAGILATVAAALVVFFCFQTFLRFYYVPSGSMLPTLNIGEVVICTRVNRPEDVDRFDIVVFSPYTEANGYLGRPEGQRKDVYVKRLIGLPGDTVSITDHVLYVNGEPQTEEYLPDTLVMDDFEEITVPEGCYFFLGDNRNRSSDCRYIGSIPFENLVGRCFFHVNSLYGLVHRSEVTRG